MALTKAKLIELFDAGVFDNYVGGGCPHGVGDILQTRNATSPTTRWPGTTWAALEGAFLIGAGGTYTAGSTGGEATHTLAVAEMPSHQHWQQMGTSSPSYEDGYIANGSYTQQNIRAMGDAVGGGAAHNNMPPYLSVYMWERTA